MKIFFTIVLAMLVVGCSDSSDTEKHVSAEAQTNTVAESKNDNVRPMIKEVIQMAKDIGDKDGADNTMNIFYSINTTNLTKEEVVFLAKSFYTRSGQNEFLTNWVKSQIVRPL